MSNNKNTNSPAMKGGPMGHGHGGRMAVGEKAKNFKKSMLELIKYLGKYKFGIFLVAILAVGSTTFSIFGPKILGNATTEIANGVVKMATGTGEIDFSAISQILLFLIAIYIVSAGLSYLQNFIITGISMRLTYRMRKEISEKINRLPLSYFDITTNGDVLSRITNDVDTVSQSLNQSLTQIITSAASIIGIFIMMLTISPSMTIIALCSLLVSGLIIGKVAKTSQPFFMAQQRYLGNINGHIEESYGGHLVIKAFSREDEILHDFDKINQKLYSSAWKSQFLSGLMMPVMKFVGNLAYVSVCIVGGFLFIGGKMQIGGIQAFIQYIKNFTMPISQLANISNILQSTAAAAERVFEFLAQTEETKDTENPKSTENIKGEVVFENVKFGYTPEKIIIKNFSAQIKPGQQVAIVGPTGAGKTTMVKLLMRYYDVNGGEIKLDGYNIKDYTRGDLRDMFGMVLQDTWLYNDTIRNNIRYGRINATDDEVVTAAKAAQAHHFIKTLPDGYDTILNEEVTNISQGQKQLLTIARAIISQPKLLILDEATSSVDTRTEILIQKAMDNLMQGKTSFVIAHRLSTIRDADVILVMKDGDIIEIGSHDELISQNGFYKELYQSQFENSAS